MSTFSLIFSKVTTSRRVLIIGLIALLGIAVTTAFVSVQTDHVIAPPSLRIMDWLWRVFFS